MIQTLIAWAPNMIMGGATWAICVRGGLFHDMLGVIQPTWKNAAIAFTVQPILMTAALLGAFDWLFALLR